MRNPPRLLRAIAAIAMSALLIPALPCARAAEVEANTNAPVLHTRTFKIEGDFSGPSGPSGVDLQSAFIGYFKAIGVNLAPPKSFFIGDRKGTLTVYATDGDLKLIEQAIARLNNVPPEVQITVRTFELDEEALFDPLFDSFSQPDAKSSNSGISGSGILTESQFKILLKHLEEKTSVGSKNKSEVTTLSGVPANFDLANLNNTQQTTAHPTVTYLADDSPLTLDVVPEVDSDGYTIKMSLIPTHMEIVADPPTKSTATNSANGGIPITGQLPPPHSRVRQLVTNRTVWDGQTAVLLLNPQFALHGKELAVFVTSVILDPSGNRKNSAESLPFAQKAVPPQTAH